MQQIEHSQHSVALVELEVVVVMRLRGGEEGEVVARVSVEGREVGQLDPEPCRGHVGTE